MTALPPLPADPARVRMIELLRWGARTVEELASLVGLTPNGVRVNLSVLEREGIVERAGVRPMGGVGKPPAVYRLTPRGEDESSRAYPAAFAAFIESVAEVLDPAALGAALTRTGRLLAARISGPDAAAILASLGASVRTMPLDNGTQRVQGASCPLGAAVAREPLTCELVRALLAESLDTTVVIRCEHGSRPRCCFEIGGNNG